MIKIQSHHESAIETIVADAMKKFQCTSKSEALIKIAQDWAKLTQQMDQATDRARKSERALETHRYRLNQFNYAFKELMNLVDE